MEAMDTRGRSQVFLGECIWRVDHVPLDGPTLTYIQATQI